MENAIELFLKLILISRDNECIYQQKSRSLINEAKKYISNHSELTLSEYLIKYLDVRTISFEQAVKKYCKEYEPENVVIKNTFLQLAKYRNAVNHFGIDCKDDIDKITCCVYQSFEILSYYMYSQLHAVSDYFKYNDFLDTVESIFEGSVDYVRELCIRNPANKIQVFMTAFQKVFESQHFYDYLLQCNLNSADSIMNYNSNVYSVEIKSKDKCILQLGSWYSTLYNATVFMDECNNAYLAIEHTQDLIYFFKTPVYYPCFDKAEGYYIWRKEFEIENAEKYAVTEANIFHGLKCIIESEIRL